MTGRCRFCGCTRYDTCAYGCTWTDQSETLCTECDDVDRAWRALPRRQLNMRRAFARGFFAGFGDEYRDVHGSQKPTYAEGGESARFYALGLQAGRIASALQESA